MTSKEILGILAEVHNKYRLADGTVSSHTRSAQLITREWQQHFEGYNYIKKEVEVSKFNNEKIDLVDTKNRVAYELKVSGKNTHHEFYKDLFKILTYNFNEESKLIKFVFISEKKGIESLTKRLDPSLIEMIFKIHMIQVELISVSSLHLQSR